MFSREAKRKIAVFRADAGQEIGNGHVMRCIALATALREIGCECSFITTKNRSHIGDVIQSHGFFVHWISPKTGQTQTPAQFNDYDLTQTQEIIANLSTTVDWLIVDHYQLGVEWEKGIKNSVRKLLVIDDSPTRPHCCDALLDQTWNRQPQHYHSLVPKNCITLTGTGFALLRPQFAEQRLDTLSKRSLRTGLTRILISIGGTDPANLTETLLETIDGLGFEIDVVLGPNAPHYDSVSKRAQQLQDPITVQRNISDMASLMAKADLAIGTGGTSSWERCSLGLPAIVDSVASNQEEITRELSREGAAKAIGFTTSSGRDQLVVELQHLATRPNQLSTMSTRAAQLCDGFGSGRVAALLSETLSKDNEFVWLRPADAQDGSMMHQWQSHPNTRKFSFNPGVPSLEDHLAWLNKQLGTPTSSLMVIMHQNEAAGVLHLDHDPAENESTYEISIYIAPTHYRKGLASCALHLARATLPAATFRALVFQENTPSRDLFLKAGYREIESGVFYQNSKQTIANGEPSFVRSTR